MNNTRFAPEPLLNRELRGADAIRGAMAIRDDLERSKHWPYPWTFPPVNAIRVTAGADTTGTIEVPSAGTPTLGLVYTVEQGFRFALQALIVEYVNNGVAGTPNPGDFIWSLTLNQAVNSVGNDAFPGPPIQGLTAVDVPLGTLQIPWPLFCPELFESNDDIRVVVTNVNLTAGSPHFIKSMLLGWKWPNPER